MMIQASTLLRASLCTTLLILACSKPPETKPEVAPPPAATSSVTPGEMVQIPAGEFTLGSDVDQTGQKRLTPASPAHRVNLPAFWIDKYEVTNGEFLKFIMATGFRVEGDWRNYYQMGMEKVPVLNVTLGDASEYCSWVGRRLPTEQEWEKAARGPESWEFSWGATWQPGKANTAELATRQAAEVGKTSGDVSAYGVHDMFGNVMEWTNSQYKAYPNGPDSPDFHQRMYSVRGSAYNLRGAEGRLWWRSGFVAQGEFGIGFRCASDKAPAT